MFLKRSSPRSIATQLVLLFTPAAALLLYGGLTIFYLIVLRHAAEEDDAFLTDKTRAVADGLESSPANSYPAGELLALRPGETSNYWIRVLERSSSKTISERPGMTELLPATIFPPSQQAGASPRTYRTKGRLFALVTTSRSLYLIQVAQDRSEDAEFARQFGLLLAVVLPVGVALAALIAVTVSRRGLLPLREMAALLHRTGPSHLDEMIVPARWPRELQPVAEAFDDLLDRLRDSFTRLSQFSADLAHELRTPVANLLGEAQVALTRSRTAEEYRAVLESSIAEYDRLSGIIDNLLFLARAEAAESHLKRQLLEGRATLQKVATFYESLAEEKQISLVCAGDGKIFADPLLLERALSNLVENALRFTPENGVITLSLEMKPNYSELEVSDTGSGIAPEHLPKIFDRFYRPDSSRSERGAGLGLALVRSIARLHGGDATAQSKPGRGTTVRLTFPPEDKLTRENAIDSAQRAT